MLPKAPLQNHTGMYRAVWPPLFLFTLLCTLVFMATCPGCPGLPFSNAYELSRHIRTCGNLCAALSEPEPASGNKRRARGGGGGGGGATDTSQDSGSGYASGGDAGIGEDFAPVGIASDGAAAGGGGAAPYPLVHDGDPGEAAVAELLAALGGAPYDRRRERRVRANCAALWCCCWRRRCRGGTGATFSDAARWFRGKR